MTICGLKLTHDSSIAVVKDNRLLFAIEVEKLNNNARFKILDNIAIVERILNDNNLDLEDIDQFAIDGWLGEKESIIKVRNNSRDYLLNAAPYCESAQFPEVDKMLAFSGLQIGQKTFDFVSNSHVAGHILSAYATSPFAPQGAASFVLVWDGGIYPRLYYVDFTLKNPIKALGPLFYFGVNMYSIFAQHFGPFKINENVIKDELSIAGKIMAYTAFGNRKECIVRKLKETYVRTIDAAMDESYLPQYPYLFTRTFKDIIVDMPYFDEDIITSFHYFIEELLIENVKMALNRTQLKTANLCYSGGAALNIKWNTALRETRLFDNIFVPPFTNDSGSAIGAACCANYKFNGVTHLSWNVYSGPRLIHNKTHPDWGFKNCNTQDLARLLYESNEPVVIMHGRAELGPRALGHRSILASPLQPMMKDTLNYLKFREPYRPIAPICLEERAQKIFFPGTPDPFMLFDHAVRKEWKSKIPAICHKDGTARLQTVNRTDNPFLHELLLEFEKLSGVPVLCNTSANFKGSGFFPDLYSISRWGKVKYIWCEQLLYHRTVEADSEFDGGRNLDHITDDIEAIF